MTSHEMHINREAISFAAFSMAKVLTAELLRKGVLDHQQFVTALAKEIEHQRTIATPANDDAATLLSVYLDEIGPG